MGAAPSQQRTDPEVAGSVGEPQKPISTPATSDPLPPPPEVTRAKDATTNEAKDAVAKKVSHMYEAIVKTADDANAGDLRDRVRAGIFLDNKRKESWFISKKYWVDERTGNNCFMVFARDLMITWSENPKYWQWVCLKDTSDAEIEAASLLNVCWLEVHGEFDMSYLNPGTVYEIAFVVMMEVGYGWAVPVNLRLRLPDGVVQQRKESLLEKPKGQWIELKAGEFTARRENGGRAEFSLYEYEGGQWKRGLILKGAIIRPKK